MMKRIVVFTFASSLAVACANEKPPVLASPPAPSAAPSPSASPPPARPAQAFDGKTAVKNACLSCHAEDMLVQQRLTVAQWTKVVTKMKGWGADLGDAEIAPLSTWLAEHYGADAGAWAPARASTSEIAGELEKTNDGAFANGDATRGRELFAGKCSACHGQDARGDMGVMLVDRPFLWRAGDVADVIRRGRGKMPPMQLTDAQIADVLAHLRSLKNPLP